MNKKEVLERIIEEQKSVIENLQESVDRHKTASDLEENSASDPDELSHQSEAKDMQLRFEQMHSEATNNLNLLESEKENSYDEIENGSLVETKAAYFYVGISIPSFTFDGKDIIAISEDAPIFKEMKSKKVGDTFKMGDKEYKILDVK